MSRLIRNSNWDAPQHLYLMVACGGGQTARVHCYRVVVARPADGEESLVAYCPARMLLVPASELIPSDAAFDLLANPSLTDLAEARVLLEREAAEGKPAEDGCNKLEVRVVELEIRALVRKSKEVVAAKEAGKVPDSRDRLAWFRDRERVQQLFRRWSQLTGIPVLFDFDFQDERRAGAW